MRWVLPTGLAVLLTLGNAAKPVVVDDTAYLFFARHLAADPLDPYGFELFWYRTPEPAMNVLLPPVLPYWLAAGIALVGEDPFLLKLWLFPFALVLCLAAGWLLRRFARGAERAGLVLLAFSPAVLPLFNFMLDVPAVALGLAAVALFVRGCDRARLGEVLLAGVLAGLAAQTKYTMLTVPVVFAWYGLTRRRLGPAVAAGLTAAAVFGAWEAYLLATYGVSHFAHHAAAAHSGGGEAADWWEEKGDLVPPLVGYLGLLGLGWGLYAGRAVGYPRWVVSGVAVLAAAGIAGVCALPYSESVLLRSRTGGVRLDLPVAVFNTLGTAVGLTVLAAAGVLCFRRPGGRRGWLRRDAGAWFLVGWLGVELAAYFALTPFAAARRVLPLCAVGALIVSRLVSRVRRARPGRGPGNWVVGYGVALGVGLLALDAWDALPERDLPRRASALIGDRGAGRVWFQGHWGWQYYCDRLGMLPVVPGRSELKAGDWLLYPVLPDGEGFYRPYHGEAKFRPDAASLEPAAEVVWDDALAAQTIPNLYGGVVPVRGRDHPRLRAVLYRVNRDWVPTPE